MDTAARDLACPDLWQQSLERSLARRGRPTRSSLELFHLQPERDLSRSDLLRESLQYSQLRRSAAARRPVDVASQRRRDLGPRPAGRDDGPRAAERPGPSRRRGAGRIPGRRGPCPAGRCPDRDLVGQVQRRSSRQYRAQQRREDAQRGLPRGDADRVRPGDSSCDRLSFDHPDYINLPALAAEAPRPRS